MTEAERLDRLLFRARNVAPEVAAREARDFFDSLPPDAATGLAESRPDQVGRLDGAPAQLRYRANHLRLGAARDRLTESVAAGTATKRDRERLGTLTEMLTPVTDVAADPAGRMVPVERHRQFLAVEPDGDGEAVEVLGDLDRARHVAVLVPGMGNDLETLRSQADRAHAIRIESGPEREVAAIVWQGYDSPDGVGEAASKQKAEAAAPALRRFQAGLDTELLPEASTTVIGHSYGSTVVGQGLLHGARFARVVLTGSPGISPDVASVADLAPPGVQVFAARAPGDYVSYTEWRGPDPASYPDVVRLRTDGGRVGVRWHNQYYRPNSESMRNVGRVVRGDLAAVTTTGTSPEGETRVLPGVSWSGVVRGAAQPLSAVYDGVAALRGAGPPRPGSSGSRPPRSTTARPDKSPLGRDNRPEGPSR